jgi:hypothetical protein
MDDATADDTQLNREESPVYAAELTGMADTPAPVWFVHHRPIWAAITGPLGIPIGGNLQLIDATRVASLHGLRTEGSQRRRAARDSDLSGPSRGPRTLGPQPLIPSSVELMLSGHIHTFEAINYTKGVPPQLVAGNGGTNLEATPRNLKGAQFQGHSGVTVTDGLSLGGFGFLLMTRAADGWDIDVYDSAGARIRACHFTSAKPGRLDCPL